MARTLIALTALLATPLVAALATAQSSSDFLLIDNIDATARTGSPDAGSLDAGLDTGPTIEIIGISEVLPPVVTPVFDLRPTLAAAISRHARSCVSGSVEPSDADVGFMYLLREGQPNATLTAVTNDEPLHLSRLHVDVVRKVGDTHPIDIGLPQRMFRECIQVVPLPTRPNKTERLSFRIKAGALILLVQDVAWTPL